MDVTISTEQMQTAAEAMRHGMNLLTFQASPAGKAWAAGRMKTKVAPITVPIRLADVDPVDQLHAIAADIEMTTGLSPAQALIEATKTERGRELYKTYSDDLADAAP